MVGLLEDDIYNLPLESETERTLRYISEGRRRPGEARAAESDLMHDIALLGGEEGPAETLLGLSPAGSIRDLSRESAYGDADYVTRLMAALDLAPGAATAVGLPLAGIGMAKRIAPNLFRERDAIDAVIDAGRSAVKPGRTTVASPNRKMFKAIYRSPEEIVEESAAKIAPENPLMERLFGVTRADLDRLHRQRYEAGGLLDYEPAPVTARGATWAEGVKTPANERRLQEILRRAATDPRYAGNYGWYETGPLLREYQRVLGPEAGEREHRIFQGISSAFSPGSAVDAEIRRASIANMLRRQGQGTQFLDWKGDDIKKGAFSGAGHAYHTTAHQMARPLLEGVEDDFARIFDPRSAPKVGPYYLARMGRQMDSPVADAHWARGVGLTDVRPVRGKSGVYHKPVKDESGRIIEPGWRDASPAGLRLADYDANKISAQATEYGKLRDWYRDRIAAPMGVPAVPAQALQWNAMGTSTGVETELGAPLLELITNAVEKEAIRSGREPKQVLDRWIRGKGHLWSVPAAAGLGAASLLADDEELGPLL